MSIAGPAPLGVPMELPKQIAKPLNQIEQVMEFGRSTLETVEAWVPVVENVTGKLPKPVDQALKGTSFYYGAMGLFAIKSLVMDIRDAIVASNVVDRVKSICRAVISGGNIAMAANAILGGLKTVGVIAKNALPWTEIVNNVLFPLQALSLGLSVHDFTETANDHHEFLQNLNVKDLTSSCQYVMKNKDRLRKVLVLSKKTNLDLRAERIMQGIQSVNAEERRIAKEEGDALVSILRRRVNTKFNLEVAGLVVKVAAVATAGISIVVPPNPVTMGIGAICAVASLALYSLEKLLLSSNKDPFAEPENVWYKQMAHKARQFVYRCADSVEKVALDTASRLETRLQQPLAVM